MDFRRDVIVINRSLLNLKKYDEGLFKRYPSIRPSGKLEREKGQLLSNTIISRLVKEQKAKVYFAATVDLDQEFKGMKLELPYEPVVEGINRRASKKGLRGEESARLFLEKYRLDSATDWNFAWDLTPSVSKQMGNYVVCMIKTAERDDISPETKHRLLTRALEIAEFHGMLSAGQKIKAMLK